MEAAAHDFIDTILTEDTKEVNLGHAGSLWRPD